MPTCFSHMLRRRHFLAVRRRRKLHLASRTQAALYALRKGLTSLDTEEE